MNLGNGITTKFSIIIFWTLLYALFWLPICASFMEIPQPKCHEPSGEKAGSRMLLGMVVFPRHPWDVKVGEATDRPAHTYQIGRQT